MIANTTLLGELHRRLMHRPLIAKKHLIRNTVALINIR